VFLLYFHTVYTNSAAIVCSSMNIYGTWPFSELLSETAVGRAGGGGGGRRADCGVGVMGVCRVNASV
jgi:hypothetical protein